MGNQYIPCLAAFDVHIWLLQGERVDVVLLKIGKGMVHESMRGFIWPYGIDYVEKIRVGFKTPVVNCDRWGWNIFPFREFSVLDIIYKRRASKKKKMLVDSCTSKFRKYAKGES